MDWLGHLLLLLSFLLAFFIPEGPSSLTLWITVSLKKLESQGREAHSLVHGDDHPAVLGVTVGEAGERSLFPWELE